MFDTATPPAMRPATKLRRSFVTAADALTTRQTLLLRRCLETWDRLCCGLWVVRGGFGINIISYELPDFILIFSPPYFSHLACALHKHKQLHSEIWLYTPDTPSLPEASVV